uniref:BOD1/SHG1 domain-containing protein n=1 Tax=Iconisemion striatum TaxID=60296 RepID=A0A1A7XJD4_9TELE
MAGLPPGDPQLVSMIVSHLKTQGLFDQFRRDCLADVDTKPAYLNLKQRVDNFVSNHLSNHTWSPHLNKNQLRNNIRHLVLQSGMLEQGVDRIVAQVVDPKVNHIFRPQVERVVQEFLSPGSCSQEPPVLLTPAEVKPESSVPEQASSSTPTPSTARDAMSILDTITSLNQEASVRASSETEKGDKSQTADDSVLLTEENEQDMDVVEEGEDNPDEKLLEEMEEGKMATDVQASEVKMEDMQETMEVEKEQLIEEVKVEEESGSLEQAEEKKEKPTSKVGVKVSEEKMDDETLKSSSLAKQNAKERIKEEYSLEDSDLEGLSDITVSSVHTSDLSSFEEESEEEEQPSDSSEEGELPPDDQGEKSRKKHTSGDTGDEDKERKPRRKAYVHKPFLYSRYYSDSDDEITVEERRRSAAKDKEERLLKRQQNRERMEEKRKQKASQSDEQEAKKQKSAELAALESPKAKEARKEKKVLEKKMAVSRKRKLDSRNEGDVSSKKKGDTAEVSKKQEVKSSSSKTPQAKITRNQSESASSDDRQRRTSGSVCEDSCDAKKLLDKNRTHSFILDLEQGSQEALKQRSFGKFDRLPRKELHSKERRDKERSLSDERAKLKQKQEKKFEHPVEEALHKEGSAVKVSAEEKEKKSKIKSEKKAVGNTKEGKVTEVGFEEGGSKDIKKVKGGPVEGVKVDKDKLREKDKIKEKEKAKGDKTSGKVDLKHLLRPDSTGSSEDRSDKEPGSDVAKKRDKHSKEGLKRLKSHMEDKPGDKPRSKTDGEKEKIKSDQDGQKLHKSSSDTDKDPKKVKPMEKRVAEKLKPKSKEEAKALLLLKADKKAQSPDVKGTGTSKPEVAKGKKKEGNKEQKKVSEEALHEKPDFKCAKKKVEKKDKVPEKKRDNLQEKTSQREDKLDKSDKSSKSSVSSVSLESEDPPKKQPLFQDVSPDSDPVTAAGTASFSEDTCDALSDITPEPPEGDVESQPDEVPDVPAEASALLTLMDVCASAEARLPAGNLQEQAPSEIELQDADMKMKEAALTLLSMDPDSTVSSSLRVQSIKEESLLNLTDPQPMETSTAEEEQQCSPEEMQPASETEPAVSEISPAASQQTAEGEKELPSHAEMQTAPQQSAEGEEQLPSEGEEKEKEPASESEPPVSDISPAAPQQTTEEEEQQQQLSSVEKQPEPQQTAAAGEAQSALVEMQPASELTEKAPDIGDESLNAETKMDMTEAETSEMVPSQEDEVPSDLSQTQSGGEESAKVPPETSSDDKITETADSEVTEVLTESEDITMDTEAATAAAASDTPEQIPEIPNSPTGQTQTEVVVTETSFKDNEEESEENKIKTDVVDKTEEDQVVNLEMEINPPDTSEETKPESKLVTQISDVSSTDGSDLSEKEEKRDGGGRCKQKLSSQKTAPEKESGDTRDEPEGEDQLSAQETEQKAVEVKTPPRGQSSRDTEEEVGLDQETEAEEIKSCRESCSEAATADESSEEGPDKSSTPEPREEQQKSEAESEEQLSLPSAAAEDGEGAENLDSQEPVETQEPAITRQPSEESGEEPQAQQEVTDESEQRELEGRPEKDDGSSSVKQSEDVMVDSCSEQKLDDTGEEEEQQEDLEPTPKKRRGRPPKAAATDDSDKKDNKADEKDGEQNDEEEDDGEKEEEGKDTKTRATTRLASRLEAERNKPSKPSTRASRQNVKEETTAGTRGTRAQAAAKGARKREASPPAARTRGGQKSEEPPSKRAKR